MQHGAWRVNGIPILNPAVVDTLRFIRRIPRPITKSTIYFKMLDYLFLVYWILFTWGCGMLIKYGIGDFDGLWGLLAWIIYTIFLLFILAFKLWNTHQDYLQVMTSRCWSESVGLDPPFYFGSKFSDGKIKVKQQASFLFMAGPKEFMFMKPEVTKRAAKACGFELNYKPELNWLTYKQLLKLSKYLFEKLSDLHPRDMIDIQSFIWCSGEAVK